MYCRKKVHSLCWDMAWHVTSSRYQESWLRWPPEPPANLDLSMICENSTQDAFFELLQVVIFCLVLKLERLVALLGKCFWFYIFYIFIYRKGSWFSVHTISRCVGKVFFLFEDWWRQPVFNSLFSVGKSLWH